jgi:hypothetical protein
MTIWMKKNDKEFIRVMDEDARSLRELVVEIASVDGLNNLPDTFTPVAAAHLRAACQRFLVLEPSPAALKEKEQELEQHRAEADERVNNYRSRYERDSPEEDLAKANSWRRPLSVALLFVFAALGMRTAGVIRDAGGFAMVACAGLILVLNQHRARVCAAHLRDFVNYRRAAWRLVKIQRSIDRNRGDLLAGMARRDWTEQWIQRQTEVLASVYKLHRGRAERAAVLAHC